jgi:Putative zinc-finger
VTSEYVGTAWHADPALMAAYASGRLDLARSASLEQHLVGCARCRAALAGHADSTVVESGWAGVVDALDQPRVRLLQRVLSRCGLSDSDARVAATASRARSAWLAACTVGVAFALALPRPGDRLAPWFLVLAPLVPLTGVSFAYGRGSDPTYEIAVAAPMSKLRLVLLRSLFVLPFTAVVLFAGGSVLPGGLGTSALWLLPALAMVALTLAAEPWVGVGRAAAAVAFAWVGIAGTVAQASGSVLTAFGVTGQITSILAVLAAAAVVLVRRSERASRRYS